MPPRSFLLLAASLFVLTLPLAAAVFRSKPTDRISQTEMQALLARQGYREVSEGRARGDVVIFSAITPEGKHRQLILAADGMIVGER